MTTALPVTTSKVADQWTALLQDCRNTRSAAQSIQTELGVNSVNSGDLLGLLGQAVALIAQIQFIQGETSLLPSFVAYVQQQLGISGFNVADAANTVLSAAQGLVSGITTDYPKDGSGFLADRKFDGSGNVVASSFLASALPNTASAITAFLAVFT